jgi:hypothetical protein
MISEDLRNLFAKILPWDYGVPTPEVLIGQMDKAGVLYAVLQAYDIKEAGMDIPNEFENI